MHTPLLLMLMIVVATGCKTLSQRAGVAPAAANQDRIASVQCVLQTANPPIDPETFDSVKARAGDGNPACMAALAMMYRGGDAYGVDQDLARARALFAKLALVDPAIHAVLGHMAEQGEGEPVDYAKARTLYGLSGAAGALRLAGLLEHGRGGAKDLPGAMELYTDTMRHFQDDAWNAMGRLRAQGQSLNAQQRERYQQIWLRGLVTQVRERLNVAHVRAAMKASTEGSTAISAKVMFTFTSANGTPQARLKQKTGDANLDAALLKAAAMVTMGEFGPFTGDQKTLEVVSPLVMVPRAQ